MTSRTLGKAVVDVLEAWNLYIGSDGDSSEFERVEVAMEALHDAVARQIDKTTNNEETA